MREAIRRLSGWFGLLGAGVALLTGFMTFVSVFMRALIQYPIPGDVELTQMGIALAISLCLPWCQSERAHIIVDFFTQRAGPGTLRVLDFIGLLALTMMYVLLAWRTSVGAISVREAGETTMIISLPMWWAYASLAPGLALAAVIALIQSMELLIKRTTGDAA
jgi:TRAP-type C4-dicarboxylate transport system permease small subunit